MKRGEKMERDNIIEKFTELLKTAIEATQVSELTIKEPRQPDKVFTTIQKQDIYDIIDVCVKLAKDEEMIENG